jgi:hypothetical protein
MKKIMLVLLAATLAQAQKPVDVRIQQVNDRRTAGSFAQLTVALELPSVKSSTVAASRVLVRTATDDAGNDLVDHQAEELPLEPNLRAEMPGAEDGPVSVSLVLKNPSRTATKLREARGEIELFMPGKDPNSTAEMTKFLPASGKPLAHKALKANGVEIAFLNAAQLDAENKRREEYARLSLDESDLAVRIKDPNKRIHSLTYVDGSGAPQRVSTRDDAGVIILSTWSGKPQPDWKLRVSMKTPKNVVRYPFALTDVTLP